MSKEEQFELVLQRAEEKRIARRANPVKCELKVTDLRHARSEEVLQFCLDELEGGTTYEDLRLKLGCGPASIDRKWRKIRGILAEMILPDSEEEALKADAAMSGMLMNRVEKFIKRVQDRLKGCSPDQEASIMKLELEGLKLLMEKHGKQTDQYLKMKDLKHKEKGTRGTTIIFNNLHQVRRPGDNDLAEAAKLVHEMEKLDGPED